MRFIKYLALLVSSINFISCKSKDEYEIAENGKSLLWQITGNGLNRPAYVFGTMHLMCGNDTKLGGTLKSVIKNADEIYFEIDLDELGELFAGVTKGFMKNDTTLQDLYSPEEYERLTDFFAQHQMSYQLQMMKRMQPTLISASLYQLVMPCDDMNGMELSIMKEAKPYHKEIKGLETASFQASIIDSIPYLAQAKELLNMVDSLDAYKKTLVEMVNIYKSQDVEQLYRFSLQGELSSNEVQDIMLNKRNQNWATQFPSITKNKSLLIAVGAGHLGGDGGLLNLLKRKGYTVRPLKN